VSEHEPTSEIHEWWPRLSIDAKHRLQEDPGAELPDAVRAEIAEITGHDVPAGTRLTAEEADFIDTQREPVD